MKILVTGASGLVGKSLIPFLQSKGHDVKPIVRSTTPLGNDVIRWDPERGFIDYKDVEGTEVFINLSGENIGDGRWDAEKKSKILNSRVEATNFLAQVLASMSVKPKLLINSSAIGYYGDRGSEVLTEKSDPGTNFLAEVCSQWEEATQYARREGVRTVLLRTGMVLTPQGGALKNLLTPFSLGLGGTIGSGKQYYSWITLDDLLNIFQHIISHPIIEGPVNAVTPNPVTSREFAKAIGKVLSRPTLLPLPSILARLILGEMADNLLLASERVKPEVLEKTGYKFLYPTLVPALKHLLKK
jgi:uncharacterized protein (TIGR01777 family)